MSNPSVFRLKLARTRQLLNNHTWTLYPHPCAVSRLCETKFWTPSNRRKKCTSLPFITIWLYSEVCTRRLYVQFATATPHGGRAVFAKVLASQRSNTKRSKWLVWPTLQCSSATKTNGNNSLSHSLSRRRLWCMAVKNHENEPMIKRWSGRGDGGGAREGNCVMWKRFFPCVAAVATATEKNGVRLQLETGRFRFVFSVSWKRRNIITISRVARYLAAPLAIQPASLCLSRLNDDLFLDLRLIRLLPRPGNLPPFQTNTTVCVCVCVCVCVSRKQR